MTTQRRSAEGLGLKLCWVQCHAGKMLKWEYIDIVS